jgi:hypothetical protein
MNKNAALIIVIIVLSLILVLSLVFGAGGIPRNTVSPTDTEAVIIPTNTGAPTSTPDSCAPENIKVQVDRVHLLMREFDDTSLLVQTTLLQASTVPLVQDLQKIKRSAEDQVVPSCLEDLKEYELTYMNSMLELFTTALAFLNAYGPNGDQNALDSLTGPLVVQATYNLQQYANEYSRLLGLTPVPVNTLPPNATATPTP